MTSNLGWHFPSSGGGEEDGVNDSGLEMFEGDHAYYLAREVIQNSIDARRTTEKFVEVRFRLTKLPLKEFPGWGQFQAIIRACLGEVRKEAGGNGGKSKGELLYEEALALQDEIPVLVAEDSNTTGLCGAEDEKSGQWYKCIRKKGSNRPSGEGGGTFGIGKHAPFPASKLRSVFYSTVDDRKEHAFTGKAILSSFELMGDVKRGTGFFGLLSNGRAAGVRTKSLIPRFFQRKEQGLSLFVMGFREEGDWKESLMRAVLENFFAAIERGVLKVIFENDGRREVVEATTLEGFMMKYAPESVQFLVALRNPLGGKPIVGDVPHIGKVELFLAHGKEFDKKVAFMRRPLIVVQKKKRSLVYEPFAGVFICDNPDGNKILGGLEPPTHDKWDAKRDPANGSNVVIRLTEWLNNELRKLNVDAGGEREDVAALADYLADSEDLPGERSSDFPGADQPVKEGGQHQGVKKDDEVVLPVMTHRQPQRGTPGGGGGRLPRKRRGDRRAQRKRGGGPGESGPRRVDLDVGVRWIPDSATGRTAILVLRPQETFQGTLRLVGVGEDGDVDIQVASAKDDTGAKLPIRSGAIIGVSLEPKSIVRLAVELSESAWEAISVETYDR